MKTSTRISAMILSGSLLALAGFAQADSHMENAVTKMDEAAEAEAKKAEAAAEAQVEKLKMQEEQAKEMTEKEISGVD